MGIFVSFEHLQKSGGKGSVPLLRKVDAVIGQGNDPLPGIGKADTQLLRQGPTEPGKGAGIVNELLVRHPRAPFYRRRGD